MPVWERALLVGALWLLGGGIGLVAGAAFVIYDLVSRPAPRDLLVLAVLLLGLAPLVVLARGLPAAAAVGPGFVEGNLVAHYLAGAGLALLVVGVLREVRAEAARGRDAGVGPGAPESRPPGAAGAPPRRRSGGDAAGVGGRADPRRRPHDRDLPALDPAQTWPALELIVVDNGSTDATWAVAERHADLALRGGPERSAQRNLGIDHAAGEWVCYVDADMELTPTCSSGPSWPGRPPCGRGGHPRGRSGRGSGPAAGPWSGAACATSPTCSGPGWSAPATCATPAGSRSG